MTPDQVARYVFVGVGLALSAYLIWGQVRVAQTKAEAAKNLTAGANLAEAEKSKLSDLLDKLAEHVPLGVIGVIMFLLSAGLLGLIDLNIAFTPSS